MPWNGSGAFNRIYSWVADAAAGIDISASRTDTDTDDITANGFGNCLTRDGQGAAAANLPMNGFRHTGVSNAGAANEYVALGQLTGTAALALNVTKLTISLNGLTIVAGGMTVTGLATFSSGVSVAAGGMGVTGNVVATGVVQAQSGMSVVAGGIGVGGDVVATGAIQGATGTITGLMNAGTVVSSGSISAASGSITGSLSAATISAGTGAITSLTVGAAAGATNPPQWGQVLGGVAAVWNDLAGSRGFGTTYTNSLTKPIALSIVGTSGSTAQISITAGGALFSGTYATTAVNLGVVAIVPAGATYSATISAGTPTLGAWRELY